MKEILKRLGIREESPLLPLVEKELEKKRGVPDFTLPYHQAKAFIEQEIASYQAEAGEQELPPISFERQGNISTIEFALSKDVDFYRLIWGLSNTLGEMKIAASFGGYATLSQADLRVHIICSQHRLFPNKVNFRIERNPSEQEIEAVLNAYKLGNLIKEKETVDPKQELTALGAIIYNPEKAPSWNYLAGYQEAKQQIKETVIFSLQHPEVYEQISRGTRKTYESNRPRAVLFEGPPGTGKTTMARIIAGEIAVPLVYVPVESIMTKWYGESERNLAKIFNACEALGDSLIFLDEIDSLATSRDSNIHEATRRILSVLLRRIDGFTPNENTILIGATNRKKDLDPALLSRFDISIHFPLPSLEEREAIFASYAQHLNKDSLNTLVEQSEGCSGRDIRNTCERAERKWASKLISQEVAADTLPSLAEYLVTLKGSS